MTLRAALALTLLAAPALATEPGDRVLGAVLPSSAHKVAELRYRSAEDWEGVLKFYKGVYDPKTYVRKSVVNQPGVKAIHLVNPSGKGWEGLNIYQANDEVRIYVVPAEGSGVKKKEKKAAAGKP